MRKRELHTRIGDLAKQLDTVTDERDELLILIRTIVEVGGMYLGGLATIGATEDGANFIATIPGYNLQIEAVPVEDEPDDGS